MTKTKHQIKFGTDGWRAIIAKEFTQANLALFTAGLASYLKKNYPPEKPLVIGFDCRFFAKEFAQFSAELMNNFGISVKILNEFAPTPVVAHAAREQKSCGAMMFTASHNPAEYMGIKYIPEYAGPATVEITNAILAEIDAMASGLDLYQMGSLSLSDYVEVFAAAGLEKSQAATESFNPFPDYKRDLEKLVDFKKLKDLNAKSQQTVVVDPMYGAGRGFIDLLLENAGFKVKALHNVQDYGFGGGLPEPKEELLGELKAAAKEGSMFAAANDGDADRFAIFSDQGNFYPANKALSIVLKYLFEYKKLKGVVARTVVTTHLLDEIAAKFGQPVKETAVGFKWVGKIMREENAVLAAEESGGMSVQGHIPEKDGLLAILLMAEVLAVTGKTLEQLWQEAQDFVGKEYFYHRLDLHFDGDKKMKFIAAFDDPQMTEVANLKVAKIDKTEGVKVYLENGSWFLARPSGTEAMCRVYIETNDKETLSALAKALEAKVAEIA